MHHLPIPFSGTGTVSLFRGRKRLAVLPAEAALSPVEHYQGLLYRKAPAKDQLLLFVFEHSRLPTPVSCQGRFDAAVIQAGDDGHIERAGLLHASSAAGDFVCTFLCRYLVVADPGFLKRYAVRPWHDDVKKGKTPLRLKISVEAPAKTLGKEGGRQRTESGERRRRSVSSVFNNEQ